MQQSFSSMGSSVSICEAYGCGDGGGGSGGSGSGPRGSCPSHLVFSSRSPSKGVGPTATERRAVVREEGDEGHMLELQRELTRRRAPHVCHGLRLLRRGPSAPASAQSVGGRTPPKDWALGRGYSFGPLAHIIHPRSG